MLKEWELLESKIDRDYGLFRIKAEQSRSPRTDNKGSFYVIDTNDWVNVIPVTDNGEIVMIRQWRHGSKKITLEIPGGLVDESDPEDAARRELLEETGYRGERVTYLGSTNPNPAVFNNLCHTYLIEGVRKVSEMNLDPDEDIEVELVPVSKIPSLLKDGTINHALVIVAFHFFQTR
ncbi:MAG: NUDIX hydrolase [Syntrophobacterales bacterium]|jgi:8-oxo-dGTP pyrophosphatase MutT (NUDIX family)|nr:NUDIX hydrolase [Syntrophobacterales bacterium]